MGAKHVKGILLHGPPGCGKTLMARQIGKMLSAREPQVRNSLNFAFNHLTELFSKQSSLLHCILSGIIITLFCFMGNEVY